VAHISIDQGSGVPQASETAAARAYRQLEQLIVTLDLPPGLVTTEGALIARLGLGRTPVREAIQRLAWEGLLEIRPRAGLAIAPLHAADWLRVMEARRGVEIVLARSAARFVTRRSADAFHQAALAMQGAVLNANPGAFLTADKQMDDAMAEAADNPYASRLAAPLQSHSRRFWYRFNAGSGLAEAAEHHVALIRAILEGKEGEAATAAARLMDLIEGAARAAARR
jgi:DNA-binding GntR family transcriptional regulator